jgi:hypothetical protein
MIQFLDDPQCSANLRKRAGRGGVATDASNERDFVATRILPVIEQRQRFARAAIEPS